MENADYGIKNAEQDVLKLRTADPKFQSSEDRTHRLINFLKKQDAEREIYQNFYLAAKETIDEYKELLEKQPEIEKALETIAKTEQKLSRLENEKNALNSLCKRAERGMDILAKWYCEDIGCAKCRFSNECNHIEILVDNSYYRAIDMEKYDSDEEDS